MKENLVFTEDLDKMNGKTIAMSAEFFINMITKQTPESKKRAFANGFHTFDKELYKRIRSVINKFENELRIELIIIADGARMEHVKKCRKITDDDYHNLLESDYGSDYQLDISNYGEPELVSL